MTALFVRTAAFITLTVATALIFALPYWAAAAQ